MSDERDSSSEEAIFREPDDKGSGPNAHFVRALLRKIEDETEREDTYGRKESKDYRRDYGQRLAYRKKDPKHKFTRQCEFTQTSRGRRAIEGKKKKRGSEGSLTRRTISGSIGSRICEPS